MPDGVVLRADRYHPAGRERAPLVLIRTPYGRRGPNVPMTKMIAERGYQVLVVSLRGTADSDGRFDGFRMTPADGPATIDWLRKQPWFPGVFATWGSSYLGYSQWELARCDIPEWTAAIIEIAPSEFYETFMYPGGVFAVGNALAWTQLVQTMVATGGSLARQLLAAITAPRRLRHATGVLPIADTDRAATGAPAAWFQQWITHERPDEYWASMDHRPNTAHMPPTVHLASGWYDFFLPRVLADYAALRDTGRSVRLLIGPGSHGKDTMTRAYLRDALGALDAALTPGLDDRPDTPVRLRVTGADRWVEVADWPPPGHRPTPWYLHAAGRLATEPAPEAPPSRYRYDPADPTPTVAGAVVGWGAGAGDNRTLEARSDVLTFTSQPLGEDLDVVGPVSVTLHVRSTNEHTDFSARLCDVHRRGRSTNLCDGITRLRPDQPPADPDGVRTVHIELWPTAHRFRPGHRIRLQVSSGAHPRYNRNPGTGDPLATATTLRPAEQEILHDPAHPSIVILPVTPSE